MKAAVLALVLTMLSACTRTETVVVRPTPPPELLEPLDEDLPEFVAPGTPGVTACLVAEDAVKLRVLAARVRARLAAWCAFATEGTDAKCTVKAANPPKDSTR